ncbi:MAG: manganese efflux pump [Clostridia bacterium]|nr:manganese efflux pump [Clostridia bacterium]
MHLLDVLLIGVALSMDAFSVAICKGLSLRRADAKHLLIAGAWFGGFQALMPLLGYYLGSAFSAVIQQADHWIAFGLLLLIGGNMIRESFGEQEKVDDSFSVLAMLPLAIATSIDALAVGVSFALTEQTTQGLGIEASVLIIGLITFALSAAGVKIGNVFGSRYRAKAELCGGIMLILIGLKILLQDLGVLHLPV